MEQIEQGSSGIDGGRWPDLTPQGRAAKATHLLMLRREMKASDLADELGYANTNGVSYLMDALSLGGVPVYKPRDGYWAILMPPEE